MANPSKPQDAVDKSRLRARRFPAPDVTIRIDSKTYALYNISLTGFALRDYDGYFAEGQQFVFELQIKDADRRSEYRAAAKVIRIGADSLAARFVYLRKDGQQALHDCLAKRLARPAARWSGGSAPTAAGTARSYRPGL